MSRRLCIGDGNDAIMTRATTLSRRQQRHLHVDSDDSFAPSPSSSTLVDVVARCVVAIMVKVVARHAVAIVANVVVRRVTIVVVSVVSLRFSKGTIVPLPPIAQKSPYAYFFVGNELPKTPSYAFSYYSINEFVQTPFYSTKQMRQVGISTRDQYRA